MSLNEIKCPHCGHWVTWHSHIDERCPNCGEYLEKDRFLHAQAKKADEESKRASGYLVISESDDTIVQIFKEFVNWLRWGTFFGISVIYFVIAIAVVIYGLILL
ncbi:MAG TPA: hypothetical protein VHC47_14325 [Mucilaginibacter sp.]|nr:hypothetical protein [Mucilaginibacter sp.]